MIYLRKEDVIRINRKTIKRHGGNFLVPDNLLNEEPLNYLIDIVSSTIFGQELYSEIHSKASVYMFNIISNHVFTDGNKRTGLEAAILFLDLNGYRIDKSLDKKEVFNFTMDVASGELTLEEVQQWFEKNIVPEYL